MLVVVLSVVLPIVSHAETLDPPENAVLAVLPFLDFDEDNRIYVDLAPENSARRMKLILDTGATFSVVTPRAAREMGVRARRTKRDPYRRKTLLGRDLLFYIDTKSSDQGSKTGWEYGLLGGNFLKDYVVEFDFENRRVRLLDPDEYEVPETVTAPDAAVIPLEIVSNRPTLFMEVNGQRSNFLFDTGAPLGTSISGEIASKSRVESKAYPGYHSMGVWGEVAAELGVADGVQLGPFRFGPVPIQVHPNGFFNMAVADQGIVGYDVMARFLVRIDYPRERLLLVRRPDWKVTWYAREWSGWDEYVERAQAEDRPAPSEADLEPARSAESTAEQRVWLELGVPAEDARLEGLLDWVEVKGWAGVGTPVKHDVVVVSGSTLHASGTDVDGQTGRTRPKLGSGRRFPFQYSWVSDDAGDSILAAELLAIRKLVEALGSDRTRIALISFADDAQVHAPLGAHPANIVESLDGLEVSDGGGMTNMARGIEVAIEVLTSAAGEGRQKSILILSDGYPTAPGSRQEASKAVVRQSERARDSRVRIHAFALGVEEQDPWAKEDVYARMAEITGGERHELEKPGEVVHVLPRINLSEMASISIHNVTSGEDGQAVRVFPDGSFDGYVKLVAGENRIRVTARGDEGGEESTELVLYFDRWEAVDEKEAQAFQAEVEAMKAKLELRSLENRLVAEAREGRAASAGQRRELKVRAEEDASR